MIDKHLAKCKFVIDFSDLIEIEIAIDMELPVTAKLPYMLTVICSDVAELVSFKVQHSVKSILSWAYFNVVVRQHGFDNIETLTEKVYALTGDGSARHTAEKLLAFLAPVGRICEELDGLEEKCQKQIVFAACVYHSLVTNKEIQSNAINRLNYIEVLFMDSVDSNLEKTLVSSLTMFDLLLSADEAKRRK